MTGLGWFAAILIGGIAGWLAEKFMNSSMGIFMNIVVGILGAVLLNAILMFIVGGTLGGWLGQLIIGFIGACFLIAIARAFRSNSA